VCSDNVPEILVTSEMFNRAPLEGRRRQSDLFFGPYIFSKSVFMCLGSLFSCGMNVLNVASQKSHHWLVCWFGANKLSFLLLSAGDDLEHM